MPSKIVKKSVFGVKTSAKERNNFLILKKSQKRINYLKSALNKIRQKRIIFSCKPIFRR